VRTTVTELLQALLQLHGDALAHLLRMIAQRDLGLLDVLTQDTVVTHLLLLHDLHPLPLERRVTLALEAVRPLLQSHGGNVELLHIAGGVARLRLHGNCHGGPSSTMTLKLAIAEAIQKIAPDLAGLEVEGATEPAM
jgi:Fe-S cluster biogenesis protein NfuA